MANNREMQNFSYETVHNFCRACLKELKNKQKFKISNFNGQIRRWLADSTVDNPLSHDIYSIWICQSCRSKLKEVLEFFFMCKQSRKTVDILKANNENKKWEFPDSDARDDNCSDYSIKIVDPDSIKVDVPSISGNVLKLIEFENTLPIIKDVGHCASGDPEKSNVEIFVANEAFDTKSESDILFKDETNLNKEQSNGKTKEYTLSTSKEERKKYTYFFPCDKCKYRSVSQQLLDIHMRTHYGLKPYQCPKCNYSFNKTAALVKHLNDTHSQKELIIICEHEECGQQFTSGRSYKDHYRQKHTPQQSKEKREKSAGKAPVAHVCEECGKMYAKLQTFKEHQYTHRPKEFYPFQCEVCSKAFVKQRTYNEHKLRHAGIKNFQCPHCEAKKTTKKELREHINSHTRERRYPCPNCPMVFYRTSNRRVHIEVVHQGIRRFVCRYCDQTFGKGDNLKNHELLHTGVKPHACTECGKRFVQRVSLRLHMKIHK